MKLPHPDPTGFFGHLHLIATMRYGKPGTWGHGKYPNATKKGPGRRRAPVVYHDLPAGTKLVKRFILDARGEQVEYRKTYAALTGQQYSDRYS